MARKFVIFTDCTIDMPKEWYDKNNVIVATHGIAIDGQEIWTNFGEVISPKEMYGKLRQGNIPSTMQVQMEQFREVFESACEQGLDAMYVAFSAILSGCHSTGCMVAKEVMEKYPGRKIVCVDTRCASLGEAMAAQRAVELCDAGMDVEQAGAEVEKYAHSIAHFFTVDDLHHLHRGGRLSKTAAMFGSLIGIKPVLHTDEEGRLVPLDKVRGKANAMQALVDYFVRLAVKSDAPKLNIVHGDCEEDAKQLAELVLEKVPNADIHIQILGPIIGVHAGPGVLGAIFEATARR